MFIVNGEILHEKTHKKEWEWMQKKFKEIRESGKKTYTFSAFRKRAMYLREDGRMVPQQQRNRLVSVTGFTNEPTDLYQTWVYATSMNALESNGSDGYKVKRGTMRLEFDTVFNVEKDIELIFFFLYISGNRHVRYVDHDANRKKRITETALQVKASNLIYNDESPIHPSEVGTEDKMRNVALAWGVRDALKQDILYVMDELWNKVKTSEENKRITKRGYKEFIEDVKQYSDVEQRSMIVKAISKGYLTYRNFIWMLRTAGGSETVLCGVPKADVKNKDEYVVQYVLSSPVVYEAVEAALSEPIPEEPKKEKPDVEPERLKRYELLSEAKKLGWTGPFYKEISKMNREELQELVDEGRVPLIENS